MSGDNGIYVLRTSTRYVRGPSDQYGGSYYINQFKDVPVWRVAHIQGIDNLSWYEENQPYNVGAYLYNEWGDCTPFYTEEDAQAEVKRMEERHPLLEYGTCWIERFADHVLFQD